MWVAKQMGHSNWAMIAQVYGKWMPDADLEAGYKAERLWSDTSANSLQDKEVQR